MLFNITDLKYNFNSPLKLQAQKLNRVGWSDHFSLNFSLNFSMWIAAAFLVSIPVFFQAPLVRQAPWLSLIFSVGWLGIARVLITNPNHQSSNQNYGSLIWGFSLSWICGTIYWGWLRAEPFWHLPIEAIALPWAIWAMTKSDYLIGAWFYLASLLGTAVTDLYFYLNNLIPHWKAIMQVEGDLGAIQPILQDAVTHLQTSWGISWAAILAICISLIGFRAMRSPDLHNWVFAGALLSTIFVDGLFAVFACLS